MGQEGLEPDIEAKKKKQITGDIHTSPVRLHYDVDILVCLNVRTFPEGCFYANVFDIPACLSDNHLTSVYSRGLFNGSFVNMKDIFFSFCSCTWPTSLTDPHNAVHLKTYLIDGRVCSVFIMALFL